MYRKCNPLDIFPSLIWWPLFTAECCPIYSYPWPQVMQQMQVWDGIILLRFSVPASAHKYLSAACGRSIAITKQKMLALILCRAMCLESISCCSVWPDRTWSGVVCMAASNPLPSTHRCWRLVCSLQTWTWCNSTKVNGQSAGGHQSVWDEKLFCVMQLCTLLCLHGPWSGVKQIGSRRSSIQECYRVGIRIERWDSNLGAVLLHPAGLCCMTAE